MYLSIWKVRKWKIIGAHISFNLNSAVCKNDQNNVQTLQLVKFKMWWNIKNKKGVHIFAFELFKMW